MLKLTLLLLFSVYRTRQALILENAALRHQIEDLLRNSSRPRLRWRDRWFWELLSCFWADWQKAFKRSRAHDPKERHSWNFRGG